MGEAAAEADILLTATGRYRVFRREHLDSVADGAVIASIGSGIEIDRGAIAERAQRVERPDPGIERYHLPDGRRVKLLTEGHVVNLAAPDSAGNPSEVMDTTFAMMARGLESFAEGVTLDPGLHPVPDRLDREVAHEKLTAMDVDIDEVTDEQRTYHEQWAFHDSGADESA